ncbi:hypothetical protein J1N35_006889 [Gossypium stocksii]|uniref:Uncharacterized protein n=1 Tax=Gossypium stocksii TaxID=47602 RepID=A0A9D3W5P8_9ROSI|nr:hypothetical protein J1N35_006889 [Gossypium stocksii]
MNINSIPMLNGINFKSWQENFMVVLKVVDLDLALRIDPPTLTNESTSNERKKRSNSMCMMVMNKAIIETFRGTMSDKITTVKEFMVNIDKNSL